MYSDLLLPVTSADVSEVAAGEAFDLADEFDATVHIIHIVGPHDQLDEHGGFDVGTTQLEEAGQTLVSEFASTAQDRGLDTETSVIVGVPNLHIASYADKNSVDLIIIGTHGRSGASRVMFGSTAEQVIRETERKVLTVQDTGSDS